MSAQKEFHLKVDYLDLPYFLYLINKVGSQLIPTIRFRNTFFSINMPKIHRGIYNE